MRSERVLGNDSSVYPNVYLGQDCFIFLKLPFFKKTVSVASAMEFSTPKL